LRNENPESAPRINNEPMNSALRGHFRLAATGTMIKIRGFVKTDVFVDTNQAGSYYGAPAVRYTQPNNAVHSFGLSVEKPGTDTPFSTQYGAPVGSSLWPGLIGFYRYENKRGPIYVAALSRSVGGVIPNSAVPDLRNDVQAWEGSASGVWTLHDTRDNVIFQPIIAKGISNYYNDNFWLATDVGFSVNGKVVATPTCSASVRYQHYWTKLVPSTFSHRYTQINNNAPDLGTSYHISHYASGNIVVQPTTSLLFGAEYVYGSLESKKGL
jgi:hypothetical protein